MSTPYNSRIYNGFVLPDVQSYSYACKKKTEMVLRGRVEAAFCENLVFITLTYDRKHLPTTFSQVQSLPIFHQRESRKRFKKFSDDFRFDYVWKTRNSHPLNLTDNLYRRFELMSESDFKNAKFRFMHSDDPQKDFCGLLVPDHLSDFLKFLRDAIRIHYNDKSLHLRFLANGEYGQTKGCTHRPHYHILIFNHFKDFDYDFFTRSYWDKAKIIQVDTVPLGYYAVQRITSYVYAHTAKVDDGNRYQNELSPTFRLMSTFGGGIGHQLTDTRLMRQCNDSVLRSLSFSLSAWNKRDSIKFQSHDERGFVYEYEIPRFFKDRVTKYQRLDFRTLTQSMCNSIIGLITNFCRFANIFGNFDLLTVFYNIGLCASPLDVLKYFYVNNYKILANIFGNSDIFCNIAANYLKNLSDVDNMKRQVYRERYANRKQQQKYNRVARGFEEL